MAGQLEAWKAGEGSSEFVQILMSTTREADVQACVPSLVAWLLPKLGIFQPLSLHDTRAGGIGGHSNGKRAKIELSLCMPSSESALLSNLVCVIQIRASLNSITEYNECVGEVMDRCRQIFDTQIERNVIFAAVMDAKCIDVLEVTQQTGIFAGTTHRSLANTGKVAFDIDLASAGFQHLLRLLSAPPGRLGYIPLSIPTHLNIGRLRYSRLELLRRGSPRRAQLYKAYTDPDDGRGPVVVKVLPDHCEFLLESMYLQLLNRLNCPHVPTVVGSEKWQAFAMQPMGQSLMGESFDTVVRCMRDVCEAMIFAYEKCDRLLHRDLSIGNVMQHSDHGYLIDWQLACVEPACAPEDELIGTPLFCGHEVGQVQHRHTLLDDLESVLYVLLHIFSNGHLPWKMTRAPEMSIYKRLFLINPMYFFKKGKYGDAECSVDGALLCHHFGACRW
jgi:hypothetical protein